MVPYLPFGGIVDRLLAVQQPLLRRMGAVLLGLVLAGLAALLAQQMTIAVRRRSRQPAPVHPAS